jgi:hypothetical protein
MQDKAPPKPKRDATAPESDEPLGVSMKKARHILDIGTTYLYQLLANGELESYIDGGRRKVTMASIKRRVDRLVEASRGRYESIRAMPTRRTSAREERDAR